MNLELFNLYMRKKRTPMQHLPEWRIFLELCEMYLKKHKIKNPIVVELGIRRNNQKKFWEQLLGAHHIGIDKSCENGTPDILGYTHDPKTLEMLKNELKGKPINILFIDASHQYKDVKKDFELYSPLCDGIVAFHDTEAFRDLTSHPTTDVWKFWDELREKAYNGVEGYRNFLLLAIHQYRKVKSQLGIGVIIKK